MVQCSGFMVQGSGFRVQMSRCSHAQNLGFSFFVSGSGIPLRICPTPPVCDSFGLRVMVGTGENDSGGAQM